MHPKFLQSAHTNTGKNLFKDKYIITFCMSFITINEEQITATICEYVYKKSYARIVIEKLYKLLTFNQNHFKTTFKKKIVFE